MLKQLQFHQDYLEKYPIHLESVPLEAQAKYNETIQMFRHLNFDTAHDFLRTRYSHTRRPTLTQIEILRAFILCAYLK